tara:strand:+ start:91 stop:735 length:645 start_codon:yes stop_codon:yes gene_type:complete
MWAKVKASQVVELFRNPKPITFDNIKHPKEIFNNWTSKQLKAIGIYDFIDGTPADARFETATTVNYKVDDSKGIVTETINKKNKLIDDILWTSKDKTDKKIPDGEDVGDIASSGLKTTFIEQTKNRAAALLKPTDWMVIRLVEDSSKTIPSVVLTYRAAVRTETDKIVKAISDCDTLDKFKALFVTEYNKDKSIKKIATIESFPDDKGIEAYTR